MPSSVQKMVLDAYLGSKSTILKPVFMAKSANLFGNSPRNCNLLNPNFKDIYQKLIVLTKISYSVFSSISIICRVGFFYPLRSK